MELLREVLILSKIGGMGRFSTESQYVLTFLSIWLLSFSKITPDGRQKCVVKSDCLRVQMC